MKDKLTGYVPLFMTAIIMTVMLACNPDANRFSSYRDMDPDSGWAYTDTITFIPLHADSVVTGDLWLCLRHTNNYPYANLWVELTYSDAAGHHHTDTVNMTLADSYGQWQGRRLGLHYQHRVKAAEGVSHVIGTPLRVRHIMRVDTIREIDLLGVEFNKL